MTNCVWARRWCRPGDRIHQARAAAVGDLLATDTVDAVVSVDAAYHFEARGDLLKALARCLRSEGRAAWSDLVLAGGPPRPGRALRAALAAASIPASNLMHPDRYARCLEADGWRDVRIERLDAQVLDGFAAWWPRYRRRHRVRPRMWLRAELTARLLRGNSRRGRMGYAVISARAPARTD